MYIFVCLPDGRLGMFRDDRFVQAWAEQDPEAIYFYADLAPID